MWEIVITDNKTIADYINKYLLNAGKFLAKHKIVSNVDPMSLIYYSGITIRTYYFYYTTVDDIKKNSFKIEQFIGSS